MINSGEWNVPYISRVYLVHKSKLARMAADKAYSYQLKKPAGTQAVKVTRDKRTKTFTGEYISLPLAAGEVVSLEFEK